MADYSLLRVLLVDDSEVDQLTLQALLEAIGFAPNNITVVSSAAEALDHLLVKKELVDVMTTDLQMPEMDGKKLVDLVYTNPVTRQVRVVMVTTEDEPALQDFLQERRAKHLQKKGLMPDQLLRVMKGFYPDGAVG